MSNEIKKLAIKFSYIGKNYHGLALQNQHPTIASHLIHALKKSQIYIEDPIFAGRTDKKVNAKAMVATFKVKFISNMNYIAVINQHLPNDINVKAYAFVNDFFSARFDCQSRHYKYYFHFNGDLMKMQSACDKIKTFKNFKSLCRMSKEMKEKDDTFFYRSIDNLMIYQVNGIYCMDVRARSFLYNMVRKIFWTVESYALGKINDHDLERIANGEFECGTGSAENLVFCCANYNCDIDWIEYTKNNEILNDRIKVKEIEYEIDQFIFKNENIE